MYHMKQRHSDRSGHHLGAGL